MFKYYMQIQGWRDALCESVTVPAELCLSETGF
jgi:hypothetical protein